MMKTAPQILDAAKDHMQDRASVYDKEGGAERSMAAAVQAFAAITGIEMTETQGWQFMQVLKLVRSQRGSHQRDDYEDGAAYAALAGEAAERAEAAMRGETWLDGGRIESASIKPGPQLQNRWAKDAP